ncbi:unnamed protein product [Amoebophrya sp. A120]|nr:unnamed protein product [Amoebophrya sp. A120]|eukprot:GSA120T00019100001.1
MNRSSEVGGNDELPPRAGGLPVEVCADAVAAKDEDGRQETGTNVVHNFHRREQEDLNHVVHAPALNTAVEEVDVVHNLQPVPIILNTLEDDATNNLRSSASLSEGSTTADDEEEFQFDHEEADETWYNDSNLTTPRNLAQHHQNGAPGDGSVGVSRTTPPAPPAAARPCGGPRPEKPIVPRRGASSCTFISGSPRSPSLLTTQKSTISTSVPSCYDRRLINAHKRSLSRSTSVSLTESSDAKPRFRRDPGEAHVPPRANVKIEKDSAVVQLPGGNNEEEIQEDAVVLDDEPPNTSKSDRESPKCCTVSISLLLCVLVVLSFSGLLIYFVQLAKDTMADPLKDNHTTPDVIVPPYRKFFRVYPDLSLQQLSVVLLHEDPSVYLPQPDLDDSDAHLVLAMANADFQLNLPAVPIQGTADVNSASVYGGDGSLAGNGVFTTTSSRHDHGVRPTSLRLGFLGVGIDAGVASSQDGNSNGSGTTTNGGQGASSQHQVASTSTELLLPVWQNLMASRLPIVEIEADVEDKLRVGEFKSNLVAQLTEGLSVLQEELFAETQKGGQGAVTARPMHLQQQAFAGDYSSSQGMADGIVATPRRRRNGGAVSRTTAQTYHRRKATSDNTDRRSPESSFLREKILAVLDSELLKVVSPDTSGARNSDLLVQKLRFDYIFSLVALLQKLVFRLQHLGFRYDTLFDAPEPVLSSEKSGENRNVKEGLQKALAQNDLFLARIMARSDGLWEKKPVMNFYFIDKSDGSDHDAGEQPQAGVNAKAGADHPDENEDRGANNEGGENNARPCVVCGANNCYREEDKRTVDRFELRLQLRNMLLPGVGASDDGITPAPEDTLHGKYKLVDLRDNGQAAAAGDGEGDGGPFVINRRMERMVSPAVTSLDGAFSSAEHLQMVHNTTTQFQHAPPVSSSSSGGGTNIAVESVDLQMPWTSITVEWSKTGNFVFSSQQHHESAASLLQDLETHRLRLGGQIAAYVRVFAGKGRDTVLLTRPLHQVELAEMETNLAHWLRTLDVFLSENVLTSEPESGGTTTTGLLESRIAVFRQEGFPVSGRIPANLSLSTNNHYQTYTVIARSAPIQISRTQFDRFFNRTGNQVLANFWRPNDDEVMPFLPYIRATASEEAMAAALNLTDYLRLSPDDRAAHHAVLDPNFLIAKNARIFGVLLPCTCTKAATCDHTGSTVPSSRAGSSDQEVFAGPGRTSSARPLPVCVFFRGLTDIEYKLPVFSPAGGSTWLQLAEGAGVDHSTQQNQVWWNARTALEGFSEAQQQMLVTQSNQNVFGRTVPASPVLDG